MLDIDPNDPVDSLDVVELVMALEETYDIEIPDNDAKKIRRVQDAINLVERLIAEQEAKRKKKAEKNKKKVKQ